METASGGTVPSSFLTSLRERRVPQIVGVYLGTSWAIIGFVDWLVGRFALSPTLSIFCFAMFACLIPTVLLLAYVLTEMLTSNEGAGVQLQDVMTTL